MSTGLSSVQPLAERVEACRAALEAYWREEGLWFDCRWYTPEQWAERGEPYGDGAELHLVFEGGLYHAVNYGWEERPAWQTLTRTVEIEDRFGLYHELGFAWSMHLYEKTPVHVAGCGPCKQLAKRWDGS
jgi:hypothetical protein